MDRCEHLPIWRCAMDLALHMETAVAGFPRAHRYALGAQLRSGAQAILASVIRGARHPAWQLPVFGQRGTGRAFPS